MKIKKGDQVRIIAGKDIGKSGIVEEVLTKKEKILIKGINIYKKSTKHSRKTPKGGIISIEVPLHWSNVRLICPKCAQATRVGFKFKKDKKKVRVCKKCQAEI